MGFSLLPWTLLSCLSLLPLSCLLSVSLPVSISAKMNANRKETAFSCKERKESTGLKFECLVSLSTPPPAVTVMEFSPCLRKAQETNEACLGGFTTIEINTSGVQHCVSLSGQCVDLIDECCRTVPIVGLAPVCPLHMVIT